jgi:nucleotide-binding universal stress UspA family protein
MFARILVPLDGSVLAEAILPQVTELATLHGAEIILLRVALAHTFPGTNQTVAQVQAIHAAEAYLGGVVEGLLTDGIKARTVVRYGHAADEILDQAEAGCADLIAMSTHGRSGVRRWMLGSVAEKVLRAATVPVLLVRAGEELFTETASEAHRRRATAHTTETPSIPAAIHHILCPVDFSQDSQAIAEYAGTLALRFGADLTVLHAVYDPLDITCSHIPHPPLGQLREEMIRVAEHSLQRLVNRNLRRLPRAKAVVVAGPPGLQITRYAREHEVDLIVMGTQGLSGLNRLIMGSTAERVIRHASCPVVSIRAAA